MNEDMKKKWTDALRSSLYQQGHGKLYEDGKYCCLGVLADVAGLRISDDGAYITEFDISQGYKPLVKTIGLYDGSHINEFWHRNDGSGSFTDNRQTFAQIADYIDETL